ANTTGYFGLPVGNTAQRPGTPTVGMMRYNSTTGYGELYTAAGWAVIGQSPPSISTVTPATYNGEAGTVFTVNGYNFTADASVQFIDNAGIAYTAATVTFIDTTQIIVTTPQDFTVAQEPLDVKIMQSSGQFTKLDCIDCGGLPTWNTPSGQIGSNISPQGNISLTVSASDPDAGATITYTLVSGSFPANISLNSSTGVISGTAPIISSDTVYNFTLRATDNAGNSSDRNFFVRVLAPPVTWQTASGSLGTDYTQRSSSFTVSATSQFPVTYSLVSGSLPTGHSLNTSSGVISGTASGVADYSNTVYTFTIRASNSFVTNDRQFSINIYSRYIGYRCSTASENGTCADTAPAGYVFNRKDFSSYGTPNGSCGAFTIGSCHSISSGNWSPTLPAASYSIGASNPTWGGDPCSDVPKRMYVQMSYGVF
ncbi:MAG: hypothetical protein EBX41_10300, partial [Chitinophagia bacterium]|nr:hypothetical protein [Chitinophagia bacterium]